MTARSGIRWLSAVGLMVSPLALSSAYLWLADDMGQAPGWLNFVALLLVVGVGLGGVALLPIARWMRVVAAAVYVVAAAVLVPAWSFLFLCAALARCL